MAPAAFIAARNQLTRERINELIMVHYPLALGMARKFARKRELQPDDYMGVAGLAIVVAVNNALLYLVEPEGLTKYVATHVRKRLMKHYQEDHVVKTPTQRQHEFFVLGYLTPIEVRPITEDDLNCAWDSRIMEDMFDVCPDEFTRKVAHLRIEGYSDPEIAVLLNVSRMSVWRERCKLRRLLKEILA
jgi:DNA-directed RNA polymerase specialized sigma24 family protein